MLFVAEWQGLDGWDGRLGIETREDGESGGSGGCISMLFAVLWALQRLCNSIEHSE